MAASIGNTNFGIGSGSVAHNNDGNTIVVFLMHSAIVTRTADCRGYAFILENAPSGSNNLTWSSGNNNWYYAIYSIVDGGEKGDHNSDTVSQQGGSACRAPVDTQDSNSMVVCSIVRRYTQQSMSPQNMTEDDQRNYADGRAAGGHTQGTGGSVDPWWNWSSTENAVLIVVEVLEEELVASAPMVAWFH